ncbi:MAG: hypothetical protein Q9208_001498 [Pyrenodesmia sp. 3 TL-2023]
MASFLQLPSEIREEIYNQLLDQPSSLFNLLTVSRCTSDEVRPWIFKHPVIFDGQKSLFRWLLSVDPAFIHYVRAIRLRLHDLDPGQLSISFRERLKRTSVQGHSKGIGSPYLESVSHENSRIRSALRLFTNLRSLTILPHNRTHPLAPHIMTEHLVRSVLDVTRATTLSISHESLTLLTADTNANIERLRLTDYALVQSPHLPEYIQSLPMVTDLRLCGEVGNLSGKSSFHRNQSIFTSTHSELLSRLREVTVCLHAAPIDEAYEPTPYRALKRHILAIAQYGTSLNTFRLWYDDWVGQSTPVNVELASYLKSSSLEHIDTGYWWAPSLHQYPSTVVTITVRFNTSHRFFPNWLQRLYDATDPLHVRFFANHPQLKEIVVYLPPEAQLAPGNVRTRQPEVTARCRAHGVRMRVFYEVFDCGRHY